MEVRCPKCYKPGICNGIPMITRHGHPNIPEEDKPVGIISPSTGAFVQLHVDVCKYCGIVIRHYFPV